MKIFIPFKESWIIDRVNRDWKKYNKKLSTQLINNLIFYGLMHRGFGIKSPKNIDKKSCMLYIILKKVI